MNVEAIPVVSTHIRARDRFGHWRVCWAIGRGRYRVDPGLYRVGVPDPTSPVLVTANYKLTFDALRRELPGVDAWILVLDTQGVNVWCAAGKGTFSTRELVQQIQNTGLSEVVSHRRLIVPQLGATGVAAHEVRRICGFRVIYGPVRARDLEAFLSARMRATPEMRRVTFSLGERLVLVGAEVAAVLKWAVLLLLVLALLYGADSVLGRLGGAVHRGAPILSGFLAGTVLVPILLPWIPGRAFSIKGAIVGAAAVGATIALTTGVRTVLGDIQVFLLGTATASFFALQFTGATTFTSPSGVEWELRRALPFHIGAVALAGGIGLVGLLVG